MLHSVDLSVHAFGMIGRQNARLMQYLSCGWAQPRVRHDVVPFVDSGPQVVDSRKQPSSPTKSTILITHPTSSSASVLLSALI